MTISAPPFKRVFVLGAGFSRAAGFPLQREILERIRAGRLEIPLMEAGWHEVGHFRKAWHYLDRFLESAYQAGQEPSLEDIFTLLDHTIARGEAYANRGPKQLEVVRAALRTAILFLFYRAEKLEERSARTLYERFATFMIESRLLPGFESDTIGVVSLNWDCLLENCLYRCIKTLEALGEIDIDYCCFTTPLGSSCAHTPSILQKAKGIFNIKMMKLHGSTNWLVCPNCKRLYTGVGATDDVWELYVRPRQCESCLKLGLIGEMQGGRTVVDETDKPLCLESFFITPTFLKIFDNAHIQSAWHNAYVNLAEASEVVFIGYSLPEADYHVRTLLRRAIRREARIVVVLSGADEPTRTTPAHMRNMFAANRYRMFFGPGRIDLNTHGVESYFSRILRNKSHSKRMATIQLELKKHRQERNRKPGTRR